jgi:hypothetical protein
MSKRVRFERRFQGFPDGALGGYAAGVAARGIDGPAEANLRSLPPMERDLELTSGDDGSVELHDGETLVLEVHPGDFELEIPETPGLNEAEAANCDPLHARGMQLYPSCFTCGPDREAGDGLRLFMGQAPGRAGMLVASWTPDERLAGGSELPSELIWAALDCPTVWAAWLGDDGKVALREGHVPRAGAPAGRAAPARAHRRGRDRDGVADRRRRSQAHDRGRDPRAQRPAARPGGVAPDRRQALSLDDAEVLSEEIARNEEEWLGRT